MIDLKLAAAAAAFTGVALLTVNWYFYSKGYHAAESKLMQEMADLRAANGIIIREQEQKYLAERDRIATEYQTTIEGLKAAHDKEIILIYMCSLSCYLTDYKQIVGEGYNYLFM